MKENMKSLAFVFGFLALTTSFATAYNEWLSIPAIICIVATIACASAYEESRSEEDFID